MSVDVEWIEGDPPPTQRQIDNERLDAWLAALRANPGVWARRPDYVPFTAISTADIEWRAGADSIYYRAKPKRQRADWTTYVLIIAVAASIVVLAVTVVTLIVRVVAS